LLLKIVLKLTSLVVVEQDRSKSITRHSCPLWIKLLRLGLRLLASDISVSQLRSGHVRLGSSSLENPTVGQKGPTLNKVG
jgi:hypothetical protein